MNYKIDFVGDKRVITPKITEGDLFKLGDAPLIKIAYEESEEEGGSAAAAYTSGGELLFVTLVEPEDDFGDSEPEHLAYNFTEELHGNTVTAIELDQSLENLFVGTKNGKIYHWDLSDKKSPEILRAIDATESPDTAITALAFL